MTTISVAMATYDGAAFLREQLDSIAAQTSPPAELVITDDGSADDTVAVVQAFAETAPFPVRLHRNPVRLGFRANFMRAMSLCTSDLIALCDQDDVWDRSKLERSGVPLADPEVLLSYHDAWLTDRDGRRGEIARMFPLLSLNPPLSAWPMRNPYGFSMTFRAELLRFSDLWERSVDNLKPREPMAHDQWLFFLASVFGTVAYIDEPLTDYRQHGRNAYGFRPPGPTAWAKLRRRLASTSTEYRRFAPAAEARAAILDEARSRLDGAWRDRAALAAARYRTLARDCASRSLAYGSVGVTVRLRAWIALLRRGAYGDRTRWTFGRKAALQDLGCLFMPRRLIARLASTGSEPPS